MTPTAPQLLREQRPRHATPPPHRWRSQHPAGSPTALGEVPTGPRGVRSFYLAGAAVTAGPCALPASSTSPWRDSASTRSPSAGRAAPGGAGSGPIGARAYSAKPTPPRDPFPTPASPSTVPGVDADLFFGHTIPPISIDILAGWGFTSHRKRCDHGRSGSTSPPRRLPHRRLGDGSWGWAGDRSSRNPHREGGDRPVDC